MPTAPEASVDLYWLPLGAGGHSVRLNGKVFEAVVARLERRGRFDGPTTSQRSLITSSGPLVAAVGAELATSAGRG
jgi:hypothetical protein